MTAEGSSVVQRNGAEGGGRRLAPGQVLGGRWRFGAALAMLLAAAAALAPLRASDPAPTERGAVDVVLVLDLSKSMRGVGGTPNIWAQVKRTATQLVDTVSTGDTVTLVTFADTAKVYPTITIQSASERERFAELVADLAADGNYTHTADGLARGLAEAARLEATFADHARLVLVLTDGVNEPPPGARGGPTLADVARPYAGKPWFVYQVQYGSTVDAALERAIAEHFPRGGTIPDPQAAAGIDAFRPVIERATEPPPPPMPPPAPPPELVAAAPEPAPPAPRSVWPWVLAAAALVAAAAIAVWRQLEARRLFGALDYWSAERPARQRLADLRPFGRRAVLGGDVPLAGVPPLATLDTTIVDRQRHVRVVPLPGQVLRFEGRPVPELMLYSGDELELGGWTFRYTGAVGRRPRAPLGGGRR